MWHGQLMANALEWLKSCRADIVMLQEVYNRSDEALEPRYRTFSELRRVLQYPTVVFAEAGMERRDVGRLPFGNAVLAKWPVRLNEAILFDTPYNADYVDELANFPTAPRVLQRVVLDSPVGELDVLNVHGPWDLVGERNSPARQRMATALARAAQGVERVVAGGDTNARPVNECWRPVEQVLTSVFGDELETTFNMRRKDNPGYATAVVDMLFVSRNIQVLERACVDVDVSDHLPLTATLTVD